MSSTARGWSAVSLPYVKDNEVALPSPAEIRDSPNIISQRTGQTIVAVSPNVLVKFGTSTLEREGQALCFLEERAPQVPAPRLYAMYQDGEELFLVMERIPGVTLDRLWTGMSPQEKSSITGQLRVVFDELRKTQCPLSTRFGAVDGGPVPHFLFYSDRKNDQQITGPFLEERDFNAGLVNNYKYIQETNNLSNCKPRFYETHIDKVLAGHRPTLTHSDLQRKNVVLTETANDFASHGRSFKVTLVDWEDAGWYPDYWEYFVAFTAFQWEEDWCEKVEDIIDAWPAETAFMKMIYTDLFF